ncbi:MAG: CAP domain-containing protein, partial [Cyanobacteria bacterium P01_A01_bin.135]
SLVRSQLQPSHQATLAPLAPRFSAQVTTKNRSSASASSSTQRQRRFVRQILVLTNRARQRAGLAPLRRNAALQRTAQSHSNDMARNGFFSHTGSNGSSFGDRLRQVRYRYSYAAENIASGRTPRVAMSSWLSSPGHRANILNPNIRHIGIGYARRGRSHYWTQVFGQPMR